MGLFGTLWIYRVDFLKEPIRVDDDEPIPSGSCSVGAISR
jgi:hypothetical protein